MISIRHTLIGICVATASVGVLAQSGDEHKGHHPADSAAPAAPPRSAPAPSMGMQERGAMDQQMKDMQAMHDKMVSAKTPEERQALMAEHMKMMQNGMAMMKQMGPMSGMGGMQGGPSKGGMLERQERTEKRMDMMESMMQMMMDRMQSQASLPPAGR